MRMRWKRSDGSSLELIHRDISPHNMLVGYNGKTKIIDFGIVKSEVNLSRTLAGAMKGKFAYMAPEQIMSKAMDHRVDVFALTASLFELLTNQRAFEAPNDFAVLEKNRLGSGGHYRQMWRGIRTRFLVSLQRISQYARRTLRQCKSISDRARRIYSEIFGSEWRSHG